MKTIALILKTDNTIDNIRIVVLEKDDFIVTITYNRNFKNAYVKINAKNSIFMPSVTRDTCGYTLTYDTMIIFPENRKEFENNYQKCINFCNDINDDVEKIITMLKEDRKELLL